MRSLPALVAAITVAVLSTISSVSTPSAGAASTIDRPADPVVLTGASVPSFTGIAPGDLVAFRYVGGWQQVPVQVDERRIQDYGVIYDDPAIGVTSLVYADNGTFTGADPNAAIDTDDEIVFMAKDAGGLPPGFSEPAGIIPGSGRQVTITDPLSPGDVGYVYLYRQNGSLDPDAGAAYVAYTFSLASGPYLTTYNTAVGPNPENSSVLTTDYFHHFSDRWVSDEMNVLSGASTGVDILDRHKALFAPGNCIRSEDTFSDGEGAFIINKSGPVRAIRSYIGANSGPLTQRDHVFYQKRQDIRTFLRVHPIGSIMDFFDYSPDAIGMTYYNNFNTGGVLINGNPDTVTAGAITWELVTGAQGSMTQTGTPTTNIPGFAYTSYYLDDSSPPVEQCTGDAFAYGSSGVWVNQGIPCTDPGMSCTNFLNTNRSIYYDGPGLTVAGAQEHAQQAATPLAASDGPWAGAGDTDGDGVNDILDNCPSIKNAGQENNDRNFVSHAPVYLVDDATLARSDALGDACDADDDNDTLADATETGGPPCASATAPTSDALLDTDGDRVHDGAECAMGSDPANAASKPPTSFPPATDTDGDRLPNALEISIGSNPNIIDTDADGVQDGWEFKGYASSLISVESDGDGVRDGCEVASINTDNIVNPGDQALLAAELARMVPQSAKIANMDLNRDGALNPGDQAFQASRIGPGKCP